MFKFLSSIRQRALTCAYDLQTPFPRTDSGKRTFLYSASILFNCLDSDCKQLAASPYCSSLLHILTPNKEFRIKSFLTSLTLLESELEFRARIRAGYRANPWLGK